MRALRGRCAAAGAALLAATAVAAAEATPPAGITWAGRHFASKAALTAWLGGRGIRYSAWALRHPGGAYLLTHPRPKPATSPPPARVAVPSKPVVLPPGDTGSSAPAVYVVPLALVFVLLGLLPLRRLARPGHQLPEAVLTRTLEIRVLAFAFAAVLVVGLLLTRALG